MHKSMTHFIRDNCTKRELAEAMILIGESIIADGEPGAKANRLEVLTGKHSGATFIKLMWDQEVAK